MDPLTIAAAIGVAVVVLIVTAIGFIASDRKSHISPRSLQRQRSTMAHYLIPGDADEPLTPQEVLVAGINRVGLSGTHRQDVIARCVRGEPIYLVRMRDHPHDSNAVALFRADGTDIGLLPREIAAEIARRLDRGSPVTASIAAVDPFRTERGVELLGVRLMMVPHRLKRRRRDDRRELVVAPNFDPTARDPETSS